MPATNRINIYCLIDPRNQAPFYVGATRNMEERKKGHLTNTANKNKSEIINQIKGGGLDFEMLHLETVDVTEASFFERFYCDLFKSFGFSIHSSVNDNYSKAQATRANSLAISINAPNPMCDESESPYMKLKEAARALKIKPSSLRGLVQRRQVTHYKPAGLLLFSKADIRKDIEDGKVKPIKNETK